MKKYNLFFLFLLGIFISSCDNDLPNELFTKRVVITENGFQDLKLEYAEDGKVSTHITLNISGTSVLSEDITAKVTLCTDTLDKYNHDKFSTDTILYYTLLPETAYSLNNGGQVTIKKGEEYALLPITFDLSKIDMYKDYILPIEVSTTSDYEIGESKYRKALLHLNIANAFSYVYTPSGAKVWNSDEGDDYISWTTNLTLATLNHNTCRMYAGGVNDTDTDRDDYVIEVSFTSDSTLNYVAKDPAIQLEKVGNENENRLSISESPDLLVKNKSVISTTLKMNYRYSYTSPEGYIYKRRFEGTFTNERTVFRDKDGNIREEK